jgi:apolipoprotein N-acyltransferase
MRVPEDAGHSSRSHLMKASLQFGLAVISGLLLVFSFPRFDLAFLAWIALAPLIFVIASEAAAGRLGPLRALTLGWVTGLVFAFLADNWVAHSMINYGGMLTAVAYAVAFLFSAVLAIFAGLFSLGLSQLVKRFGWGAVSLVPVLWVSTEWLRPLVTGVTWNALGISQWQNIRVAQLSRVGGVHLVSWEVAAASAFVVLLVRGRTPASRRGATALALIGLLLLIVPFQAMSVSGSKVVVAGVQPNLPLEDSGNTFDANEGLNQAIKLSQEAIDQVRPRKADLVVWAEAPISLFYETDQEVRARLDKFAAETGCYLICNTVTHSDGKYFNSVETIGGHANDAPMARYDKIRLVPFGEYVPWRAVLGRFVPAIVGTFAAGKEAVVNTLRLESERTSVASAGEHGTPQGGIVIEHTTSLVRVGSFICYEAAYPNLVRQFVLNRATLLVNVSNDAWFGNTSGARQHLAHATMRAIENERDLIRVTNSGVSALITSDGEVINQLPEFTPASRTWMAQTRSGLTPYTRFGDWFAIVCTVLSATAVAASFLRFSGKSR